MNWLCGRYLQLICGWHTPNIRLIYGQKLILRIWLYGYHSCFLYDEQYFSFRPYIWRMSAVCHPYVRLMPAVYHYPPYVSRLSAVCPPYVRRISAVCQPSVSRGTAVCQTYVSRISAVCQPYLISQFANHSSTTNNARRIFETFSMLIPVFMHVQIVYFNLKFYSFHQRQFVDKCLKTSRCSCMLCC